MAAKLETVTKRYIWGATDTKPRPGVTMADGTTVGARDLPPGSTGMEWDSRKKYIWDGSEWRDLSEAGYQDSLMEELIAETRAVRAGLELQLMLGYGVQIDLRTEEISKTAS